MKTDSHLIIINRAALAESGGWIHIVPAGELRNHAAGLVQVLDEKAFDSILANIEADRQRLGDRWPGVYAGEEHFIYNDAKSSAAFAWFKDFEKRADGIWAKDDGLTDLGREAVQNRRFKFTSFVADRRDTEPLDGNKVRILKIDTVGFTNQANGKELLTPICNRENFAGEVAPAVNQNQQPKGKSMQNIAKKLGLAAEASEEAVLEAIAKLQERATALESENKEMVANRVEADLVKYADRFTPEAKDTVKAALLRNRAETVALLESVRLPAPAPAKAPLVLNRGDAKTPAPAAAAPEAAMAEKIVNRANVLVAGGMKFEKAWNQARTELAEPDRK